jgi:hypothetical protein
MALLGIGYSGSKKAFLTGLAEVHSAWLRGDRHPRFFGDAFLVMHDSNTAREFAKKCREADHENAVFVYPMERSIKH